MAADAGGRRGTVDLTASRRIHVVNVGGAGMSAIATILAQMGHQVSGVDDRGDAHTPFLAPLRDLGVAVHVGSAGLEPASAAAVDLVVVSTATPPDHADVVAAHALGVPVLHRSDALAAICDLRRTIAVAGTHGKSTTSAMLATILVESGDGAGYLVGTRVSGLGRNADWRSGPGFVVEADESDGTFLRLGATDAVVTNLEADHLSYWGTEAALAAGFRDFVAALPGTAVLCLDDLGAAGLVDVAISPLTFGTDSGADLHISDVRPAAGGIGVGFRLAYAGDEVDVEVPAAPGLHNARNAAGAIGAAVAAGVPLAAAARALGAFAGVARRFELRGEVGGITFVDSYDHLPTEVAAALAAARTGPFERIVCVFQPHRFTRTRDLAHAFADAFVDVDVLGVTELYAAGETPIDGVTGRLVLDAVLRAHPASDATFLADLDSATEWLVGTLRPGDLCITLNAGDLTTVPDRVIARLERTGGGGR